MLRTVFVLAGVGAFAATLANSDMSGALVLLFGLGPVALVALLPHALWTAAHAEGWRRLLATLGHRPSRAKLTTIFFGTEAVLLSMPAGAALAESLSVLLLRRKLGVPVADGLSSIATKKALVILTNALYVAVALVTAGAAIDAASRRLFGSELLWWALLAAMLVLALVATLMLSSLSSGALAARLRGMLRAVPIRKLQAFLDERSAGVAHADDRLAAPFRDRRKVALAAGWFAAHWALEAFETYLLLRLLGAPVTPADALAIEVVGSLVRSSAVMMPAGIGLQDASYVAMFGAFGLPAAPALGAAFVLLKRAKEIVWIAVGYALLAIWRSRPEAATPSPTIVASTP